MINKANQIEIERICTEESCTPIYLKHTVYIIYIYYYKPLHTSRKGVVYRLSYREILLTHWCDISFFFVYYTFIFVKEFDKQFDSTVFTTNVPIYTG